VVRFLASVLHFSVFHIVEISSGARPAFYPKATSGVEGGSSPEVKRSRREADHSSPTNAEVEIGGAIPLVPHMPSWLGA
jgi:hypothetical protein